MPNAKAEPATCFDISLIISNVVGFHVGFIVCDILAVPRTAPELFHLMALGCTVGVLLINCRCDQAWGLVRTRELAP